jgi:hypothetical protein
MADYQANSASVDILIVDDISAHLRHFPAMDVKSSDLLRTSE